MFTLQIRGRLYSLDQPLVMGILNITPDSFYSSSRQAGIDQALRTAEQMLKEGAAILDIGGQSTRPGSTTVGADEETSRVVPVIEAIAHRFPDTWLSVDTYHASLAKAAVEAGAGLINDISGGSFDTQMLSTAGKLKVPYICMHVEGNAGTMHKQHIYKDVVTDVIDYFVQKQADCAAAGITDLILDPGFGFSKTPEQNFQLIRDWEKFHLLQKPLLLGVSRKSTIYKTLGITAEQALNGTTVLHTAALLKGVQILRVHDVKEAREAIQLTRYLV
jgi:dihydropteroate synthase